MSAASDETWRRTWKKFPSRTWEAIRDSWIAHVAVLSTVGARPNPGLQDLAPLISIVTSDSTPDVRFQDVPGIRTNAMSEALYLFHKCSHTHLAAQRLAVQGMHSWCLFNAYHSAYIGARGIMALLGVAFPKVSGVQIAIDLFPESNQSKTSQKRDGVRFDEFVIFRLPMLDQRRIWQGLQRTLRVSRAQCWVEALTDEILSIDYEDISPPRNHFLYQAHYWPFDDLTEDCVDERLAVTVMRKLDAGEGGFLLRLNFLIYRLFEELIRDLAMYSPPVKMQFEGSRCVAIADIPELSLYRDFVSRI